MGWLVARRAALLEAIEPLQNHAELCDQIRHADKRVEWPSTTTAAPKRLTTVPSVGPVTAVTFAAVLDNPGRVRSAKRELAEARQR